MVAYTDKTARVYMSTTLEELSNLTQYTDPLSLGDSLKDMTFTFEGGGIGTYGVDLTIINPSFQF